MTEAAPRLGPSTTPVPTQATGATSWTSVYWRLLVSLDVVAVSVAVLLAAAIAAVPLPLFAGAAWTQRQVAAVTVCAGTLTLWLILLSTTASRSPRVVGTGATEYRRVAQSTFLTFGAIALVAYVFGIAGLRYFLAWALAIGMVALLALRWLARKWLVAERRRGRMSRAVLLVGSTASIAKVAGDVQRNPAAGFRVVGACTPGGIAAGTVEGTDIPLRGTMANLTEALEATGADTVIVTSANELSAGQVRELSWQLEPGHQHLIVAPSLTDIGGPRLHTRPVNGLPLIHVETPRYEGGKLYAKRIFDVVASGTLILVLSPALLAIAMAVRLSTPGTTLFRQDRIGLKGRRFRMLKFRSMYDDAEQRLGEVAQRERAEGNAVLFKMRDDPRVTPVGRVLRRYSLDELPQLFNVFSGSMSLVGPRPPLDREVEQYSDHVHRRFLVKPGITGLWQVSGRSNLDWDETVRLDLYYVENWTITGDLFILWKTVRAVFHGEGAY